MILIVDTSRKNAESISDIFYYLGFITKAVTPAEVFKELSYCYKSLIICHPENIPDLREFVNNITSQFKSIPMFSISDDPDEYIKYPFIKNYNRQDQPMLIIDDMLKELSQNGCKSIGYYRISGIEVNNKLKITTFFGDLLPLTKTETMILRYLIVTYPIPQSAKNILNYSFKPTRQPEITSIRTHLSSMNKKFRQFIDRNLIISIPEKGYVICTPEILESLKLAN